MFNHQSVFLNDGRIEIEGSFDLTSGAAVSTQSNPDGSTFTVTGQGMSVSKSTTGTYAVTVKTSNMDQGPVFNAVQLLDARADLVGAALAGAIVARLSGKPSVDSTTGDITFTILTTGNTGTAADTTDAITVTFRVVLAVWRMANPL